MNGKLLVTGADSFIGRNLVLFLRNRGHYVLDDSHDDVASLLEKVDEAGVVFHTRTLYRSDHACEFNETNVQLTKNILDRIGQSRKAFVYLSSIQAGNDTPYGQSKKNAENCVLHWSQQTGNEAFIFRLGHEFGKWCPPNLNSVVATFCSNLAVGDTPDIYDPYARLYLMYIDDIVKSLGAVLEGLHTPGFCQVEPVYESTVGSVAETLVSLRMLYLHNRMPHLEDPLASKLFSTYMSYLAPNSLALPLKRLEDARGSFTELMHFSGAGQVSVNTCRPGITRGNHWHDTKVEVFMAICGKGEVRLRRVGSTETQVYILEGNRPEQVAIPPGYTHSITNTGDSDLVVVIWANEEFDPSNPDTYYEVV